jgi:hypothetical protein
MLEFIDEKLEEFAAACSLCEKDHQEKSSDLT